MYIILGFNNFINSLHCLFVCRIQPQIMEGPNREKNKERLQQKRHDYYEENKDRIKEYVKQWRQDNPSLVWLQKQEYFEKNKDKINEYRRRKYAENKETKSISV